MKQLMSSLLFRPAIMLCLTIIFISSCKEDPFKGLTASEKKLAEMIIHKMKTDTSEQKNGLNEPNSESYYYYSKLLSVKQHFDPIDEKFALDLQKNYLFKKALIERGNPNMRISAGGRAEDTRAIWIPSDSLYKLMGALTLYEIENNTKTGLQIVLGSYRHNLLADREIVNGERTHRDSLSGRTTLVFVATYDTVKNQTSTIVTRHKKIALGNKNNIYGLSIYNHGALCPDTCPETEF